jgi:hypothetical protein
MERSLKSTHPVLEEHDEQLLLDHRGRIVKRQQIRERVSVIFGLLQ